METNNETIEPVVQDITTGSPSENTEESKLDTLIKENEELKQRLSQLESDYRSLYQGFSAPKKEAPVDEFDNYCSIFFKNKRR